MQNYIRAQQHMPVPVTGSLTDWLT